jgi:RNA polymerase sigma-70 factor (TIGR02957 family)
MGMESVIPTEQLYASYKSLLFSLAYRMLGSVMDAEDIVQEAFLTLNKVSPEHIHNMKSYLCKIVTNRCIDHIRSARKQREVYTGPWLPEPLIAEEKEMADPAYAYLRNESISTAYLLLLQQLSWVERAVFLLREVLQYEYDEIADIVGKSSTNCRQIFHRAKRSIGSRASEELSTMEQPEALDAPRQLVKQFVQALTTGNVGLLLTILSKDATLYSDGGGKVQAAIHPILGGDRISRFLLGIVQKSASGFSFQFAIVNEQPGIITYVDSQVTSVCSFQIKDNRMDTIYIVVNPDKLRHVR